MILQKKDEIIDRGMSINARLYAKNVNEMRFTQKPLTCKLALERVK